MTGLLQTLRNNYKEIQVGTDPIVDKWLFMQSPLPIMGILAFYLYFVLKLGPQLMKNRQPMELKPILIGYNAYQVVFSIWLCGQVFDVDFKNIFIFGCRTGKNNPDYMTLLARGAWWYFFSKIIELMDTIFFVLRKKQSQVTFLHVYHHTITAFFSWGYLKYVPGEQGVILGLLNSFVHIVMYFYYMVSAMGPKYQKYIWWKKYMTKIQLTQFCLMLSYLIYIIAMDCNVPRSLTFFFVGNVIIFLYLFGDFYRKTYQKNAENQKLKLAQMKINNHNDGEQKELKLE